MAGVKPLLETIGALLPKGIKAWHASPHDFDKVDLSKIGTGQGAASYGPGFYAAESPKVSGLGGEYWKEFAQNPKFTEHPPTEVAMNFLEQHKFDRQAAAAQARKFAEDMRRQPDVYKRLNEAAEMLEGGKQVGPRVYELNLKADPQSFLQWDEPLAAQPHITKKVPQLLSAASEEAYNRYLSATSKSRADDLWEMSKNPEYATGEMAFRAMPGKVPGNLHSSPGGRADQTKAMEIMRDAGIPGIRYLDEKSRSLGPAHHTVVQNELARVTKQIDELRASGDNLRASELDQHRARLQRGLDTPRTYNYVVNNPDIIEIMRKLAIPGMLTGGAASVYQPQGQQ